MRARPSDWPAIYAHDLLLFCRELLLWIPDDANTAYLKQAERGYRRVGVVEPMMFDFTSLSVAIVLWRMIVVPGSVHFILAANERVAKTWFLRAEEMLGRSEPDFRREFLFTKNRLAMTRQPGTELSCVYLEMGLLGAAVAAGRPTTLVVPDLDRIPSSRVQMASSLITTNLDFWIARILRGKVSA